MDRVFQGYPETDRDVCALAFRGFLKDRKDRYWSIVGWIVTGVFFMNRIGFAGLQFIGRGSSFKGLIDNCG